MRTILTRDSILSSDSYVAPAGPLELTLAGIWATALAVDRVGRNDDFFEIGGDSVAALEICTAVSRDLNLEVLTRVLIRAPTVASFGCIRAAARAGSEGTEGG